jgi:hypothetical protein
LHAQSLELRVLSEFQRVEPSGAIVAPDKYGKPREILSPAVVRNAYASFLVAVTAPSKTMYFLYVQANPANVVGWKFYEVKELDRLQEVRLPAFGIIPDGVSTRLYLVDVWVPAETTPGGMRLEVLAKTDTWRIAPMELRILRPKAADLPKTGVNRPLPPVSAPAAAAARQVVEAFLEGRELPANLPADSLRAIIRRNALQDMTLAEPEDLRSRLSEGGGEWYLKIRDHLYRKN